MFWGQSAFVWSCFTFDQSIFSVEHLTWNMKAIHVKIRPTFAQSGKVKGKVVPKCTEYANCSYLIRLCVSVKVGIILIKYWHSTPEMPSFLWHNMIVLWFPNGCNRIIDLIIIGGVWLLTELVLFFSKSSHILESIVFDCQTSERCSATTVLPCVMCAEASGDVTHCGSSSDTEKLVAAYKVNWAFDSTRIGYIGKREKVTYRKSQ